MSRDRILGGIRMTLDADTRRSHAAAERRRPPRASGRASAPRPCPPGGGRTDAAVQGLPAHAWCRRHRGRDGVRDPGRHRRLSAGPGLPLRLRRGADPLLSGLPWERAPSLRSILARPKMAIPPACRVPLPALPRRERWRSAPGPDNPVTLGFLPDTHLVVLRADTVVGSYEEACAMVLAENGGRHAPHAQSRHRRLAHRRHRRQDRHGRARTAAVGGLPSRKRLTGWLSVAAALQAARVLLLTRRRALGLDAALIVGVGAASSATALRLSRSETRDCSEKGGGNCAGR